MIKIKLEAAYTERRGLEEHSEKSTNNREQEKNTIHTQNPKEITNPYNFKLGVQDPGP